MLAEGARPRLYGIPALTGLFCWINYRHNSRSFRIDPNLIICTGSTPISCLYSHWMIFKRALIVIIVRMPMHSTLRRLQRNGIFWASAERISPPPIRAINTNTRRKMTVWMRSSFSNRIFNRMPLRHRTATNITFSDFGIFRISGIIRRHWAETHSTPNEKGLSTGKRAERSWFGAAMCICVWQRWLGGVVSIAISAWCLFMNDQYNTLSIGKFRAEWCACNLGFFFYVVSLCRLQYALLIWPRTLNLVGIRCCAI